MKKTIAIIAAVVVVLGAAAAVLLAKGDSIQAVLTASETLPEITTLELTTNHESENIELLWDKAADASGYIIYRSTTGKTGSYEKIAEVSSSQNTYKDNSGLKSSTAYYYAVRAFKKSWGKVIYGNYKKANLSTEVTKEYLDELWEDANEAYSYWLYGCVYSTGEDEVTIEDRYYYRVEHSSIKSVSDLVKYEKKYFDESILGKVDDDATEFGEYIDYNGELYNCSGGVGTNFVRGVSSEIKSMADKEIIYTRKQEVGPVEGEYVYTDYTFVYKKGRWILTAPSYVYENGELVYTEPFAGEC